MSLIIECNNCSGDLEEHQSYTCDICDITLCGDCIEKSPVKDYDYLCFDCKDDIVSDLNDSEIKNGA